MRTKWKGTSGGSTRLIQGRAPANCDWEGNRTGRYARQWEKNVTRKTVTLTTFGSVPIQVLTEIGNTFFCRWRAKVIGTHGIFIGKEWWTIVMCIVATLAVA